MFERGLYSSSPAEKCGSGALRERGRTLASPSITKLDYGAAVNARAKTRTA